MDAGMNRRRFMAGVGAAAASAIVPSLPDEGVALQAAAHPVGFGLAPLKAEGSRISYDAMEWVTLEKISPGLWVINDPRPIE